jgi:hypothetical protein
MSPASLPLLPSTVVGSHGKREAMPMAGVRQYPD